MALKPKKIEPLLPSRRARSREIPHRRGPRNDKKRFEQEPSCLLITVAKASLFLCWSKFALSAGRRPGMLFHVDSGFEESDAFGFEKFALQTGVRLANQEFAAVANYAMPGDGLSGRSCGHCPACSPCASAEPQSFRESSVGKNTTARNLFYEGVDRSP